MSGLWQQLNAMFARLSEREQRMVTVLGAAVGLTLVYTLLVAPLLSGRERLERSVESLGTDLGRMTELAAEISALEARLGNQQPRRDGDGDFSLFSFVDRIAASSVERESIESMNPSRRQVKTGLDELIVELRLSRVSLGAIVALLRGIEESGRSVYVKQMEMKRRYDDRTRFDLTLVAATLVST